MNLKELHTLGIDIGSTTVKIAILDEDKEVLFSDYERHFANIQETLSDLVLTAGAVSMELFYHNPRRNARVMPADAQMFLARGAVLCYHSLGFCIKQAADFTKPWYTGGIGMPIRPPGRSEGVYLWNKMTR